MYYFDAKAEVEYLVDCIREYFIQNGPKSKAVLGISGGKDSTITAALLVRALGKERVVGVLMPNGRQEDIDDSYEVCNILGIKSYRIDVKDACDSLYNQLRTSCNLSGNDTITTNTPARVRMTALYMVAASLGGRVINTCNASEDYIGYSTKYGDLAGDFGVLKNYTVKEVLEIGDCLDELPAELVHRTPSDGMCGKSDEDNFGFTYEELDSYLLGVKRPSLDVLEKIEQMHKRNVHKECIKIPAPLPKTRDYIHYTI